MKFILVLLTLLPIIVNANDVIESDNAFSNKYMEKFKIGVELEFVYAELRVKKDEVSFYNNCSKVFEYPMQKCDKGYGLVTTIKLPGHDTSLGKGDLQMYFSFSNKQKLVNVMHEIYYPEHH